MDFILNTSLFTQVGVSPFHFIAWAFVKGWFIVVAVIVFYVIPQLYLIYKRGKYDQRRQFTLLAIDIPKMSEQSPKAAEHIFEQLSGIPHNPSFYDTWVVGFVPESFSFEIVSMGGYIQFLVQTPTQFRDLVEAAIYAQYPDAEITEVEDYAQKTKGLTFPHPEYDMWGTEFIQTNQHFFPIKTHPFFEHSLSQELKDPMAALLESMSRIGPDEQIWLQFVITPAADKWKDPGEAIIKKIIGEEYKPKKSRLETITDLPIKGIGLMTDVVSLLGAPAKKETRKEAPNKMQYLTPGEKSSVEAIETKLSKIGFYTKFRMVYLGRKASFKKGRGVYPIIGAIKQFNIVGFNGFKSNKKKAPTVDYFFKQTRNAARKNRILRHYRLRARHLELGYFGFVLNAEELASLYHFPVETVKTSLVKRTEAKKSEPPTSLPIGEVIEPSVDSTGTKGSAPGNLPT